MLKLTSTLSGEPLYIKPSAINAIESQGPNFGSLVRIIGVSYEVNEKPEEIMAMPEMLYEMHPAMIVSGHDSIDKMMAGCSGDT